MQTIQQHQNVLSRLKLFITERGSRPRITTTNTSSDFDFVDFSSSSSSSSRQGDDDCDDDIDDDNDDDEIISVTNVCDDSNSVDCKKRRIFDTSRVSNLFCLSFFFLI